MKTSRVGTVMMIFAIPNSRAASAQPRPISTAEMKVATCGLTPWDSMTSRGMLPSTATTPEATAVHSGELNMVAQPKTAKKLAASIAVHTASGGPSSAGTGSGESPARLATSHTPMVMASSTIAA